MTTSLTDSLLFILAFSVRVPNHERLRDTFWLHVAFLHHHFSFYFTWTFLSFHFCLIIRILLSQTRDSHKERTKHAEDGLQGILGMWFWLRTVMEYGDGERLPWILGDRGRRSEERRIERNSATDGEEDVGRIRSR